MLMIGNISKCVLSVNRDMMGKLSAPSCDNGGVLGCAVIAFEKFEVHPGRRSVEGSLSLSLSQTKRDFLHMQDDELKSTSFNISRRAIFL